MTYKEAIRLFKQRAHHPRTSEKKVALYSMALEALEKQIPMKTTLLHETDYDVRHYLCPVCDEWVSEGANYCYGCGQAIDWGDNE